MVSPFSRKELLFRALTDAADAHHEYEEGLGHPDENWADWYAEYMAAWFSLRGWKFEQEDR